MKKDYFYLIVITSLLIYIGASVSYYGKELRPVSFHPFLQSHPRGYDLSKINTPKPKGVFRIIALGGSTTEKGYPENLERTLNTDLKNENFRVEVINAGVAWFTTQHSIIQYLFRLKDLSPDLIIFQHAINDIYRSLSTPSFSDKGYMKDYGHYYGPISRIWKHNTFEHFFIKKLGKIFGLGNNWDDLIAQDIVFKSHSSFERNLETMLDISKTDKVQLIITSQPHYFQKDGSEEIVDFLLFPKFNNIDEVHYPSHKSWYKGMMKYNETAKRLASSKGAHFIDLAIKIKEKKLFRDAVHLNNKGILESSKLIYEYIISEGLISKKANLK